MPDLVRPPSLSDMFDAELDLERAVGRDNLELLSERLWMGLPSKASTALFDAWTTGAWHDGEPLTEQQRQSSLFTQEHVNLEAWMAELDADEDVRRRLEEALPDDLRAEVARIREECRHPHRLLLMEAPADRDCGACGEPLVGPVIVPDDCGDVAFCGACIEMAAEAIRTAQGPAGGEAT